MKGEINNYAIRVRDFNTPLTPMDRSTKQKINKETQTLFFFSFICISWRLITLQYCSGFSM